MGGTVLIVLLWLALFRGVVAQELRSSQREQFLQAEQLSAKGRIEAYETLATRLKSYPLYPYLQYQHLQRRLDQDNAVLQFIQEYANTRYATPLKQQWLVRKGQLKQWNTLLTYAEPNDDAAVSCYWGFAEYYAGEPEFGFLQANRWALSGQKLPDICEELLQKWPVTQAFKVQRWQAALLKDNLSFAETLSKEWPSSDLDVAKKWQNLYQQPAAIEQQSIADLQQTPVLLVHVLFRWLDREPLPAVNWWDSHAQELALPALLHKNVEQQVALVLALQHDARAFQRLSLLDNSDATLNEWRVRAALLQQDWPNVLNAIQQMPQEQQNQDKWRYWQARARSAIGQNELAQTQYKILMRSLSFYGLVAQLRVNQSIQLTNQPLAVSAEAEQQLAQQAAFQAVYELRALDRRFEANRQWRQAIQGLDAQNLKAAAKLAQSWHWPSVAIATVAKAEDFNDLNLRYPLEYQSVIEQCSEKNLVDAALLFALIRQESAFDAQAESPAGAKGLLQLLPSTAREMAKRSGLTLSDNELWQPERTICLGGRYISQLIKQFNEHYPAALAAYNAGAKHSQQWLMMSPKLPIDIWIETIPYKETRQYVFTVIQNWLIYQFRLGKQQSPIHTWLVR